MRSAALLVALMLPAACRAEMLLTTARSDHQTGGMIDPYVPGNELSLYASSRINGPSSGIKTVSVPWSVAPGGLVLFADRSTLGQATFQRLNHFLNNEELGHLAFGGNNQLGTAHTRILKQNLWHTGTYAGLVFVESSFTPPNDFDLAGSGFHVSRLELTIDQWISTDVDVDGVPGQRHDVDYTFRIYGDVGEVPEPAALTLALAMLLVGSRRLTRRHVLSTCVGT